MTRTRGMVKQGWMYVGLAFWVLGIILAIIAVEYPLVSYLIQGHLTDELISSMRRMLHFAFILILIAVMFFGWPYYRARYEMWKDTGKTGLE